MQDTTRSQLRRLSMASVTIDWGDQELILDVPISKRHNPHKIADQFQFRSPPPNGIVGMNVLETVDNSHPNWFDLRLLYRPCPIDPDARSHSGEGFTIRVAKRPIVSKCFGELEELEPDDACLERLTPSRLGQFIVMLRTSTLLLAGRPIHFHGLLRFGEWYRTGVWSRELGAMHRRSA